MDNTETTTMSDSSTDEETEDTNTNSDKVKVELQACDLKVTAEADEDFETVFNHCSKELESIMRHHLVGEMEVIEEEEIHSILLG